VDRLSPWAVGPDYIGRSFVSSRQSLTSSGQGHPYHKPYQKMSTQPRRKTQGHEIWTECRKSQRLGSDLIRDPPEESDTFSCAFFRYYCIKRVHWKWATTHRDSADFGLKENVPN
jgi:hypothetical protein